MDEARDGDTLRRRARRAYELGRLRAALPWAIWPAALAWLAVLAGTTSGALALGLGLPLAMAAAAARFAGGPLARAVPRGLAAGTLAFLVSWAAVSAVCRAGCAAAGVEAAIACGSVGLLAGAAVATVARSAGRRAHALLFAATLAAGAGALGCAFAGSGAVLGLAIGVAAASAPWVVSSARGRA